MSKHLLKLVQDNASRGGAPIRTEVKDKEATIYLYDVIDPYFGISAIAFVKELTALEGKRVNLMINSPGGDVFEARAMCAAIAKHGDVHAYIDGLAASAATCVATSASSVEISKGSFFMIHNAWTFAYGNKDDLTKTAALLDKVDQSIIADYVEKTGKSEDEIAAWMSAETWFTAEEAVEHGFVDTLYEPESGSKASNRGKWNVAAFANAPKALLEPAPAIDDDAWQQQRAANMNRLRLIEAT
jgi:ATP-dependent Clp protease, protease subunit